MPPLPCSPCLETATIAAPHHVFALLYITVHFFFHIYTMSILVCKITGCCVPSTWYLAATAVVEQGVVGAGAAVVLAMEVAAEAGEMEVDSRVVPVRRPSSAAA